MKKLLVLLALASVAFAAEPTIRVNDLGNVYRINPDGTETNLGAPYDAITNNPALGSAIQQAAQLRLAQFKAETQAQIQAATDAAAAQVAAKEAEKQAVLTAKDEAHAAALAAKGAEIAALRARIAELEAAAQPPAPTPEPQP